MKSNEQTLRAVKNAFVEWRHNHAPSDSIPDTLWALVSRLKAGYRLTRICSELDISMSDLHKHLTSNLKKATPKVSNSKAKASFIEVPLSEMDSPQSTLKLSRSDGSCLKLQNLTAQQFHHVIDVFLKETPCSS